MAWRNTARALISVAASICLAIIWLWVGLAVLVVPLIPTFGLPHTPDATTRVIRLLAGIAFLTLPFAIVRVYRWGVAKRV